MFKVGLGEDSHRFDPEEKPLMLGGFKVSDSGGLLADSDGDVLLHALIRAIATLGGEDILSAKAQSLASLGQTDSRIYLKLALESLKRTRLTHLSAVLEAKTPRLQSVLPAIRRSLSELCGLPVSSVGIVVHSGEGLSDFGRGLGIRACVVLSGLERTDN